MLRVTIRFYEELNDFIPEKRRKKDIEVKFSGKIPPEVLKWHK